MGSMQEEWPNFPDDYLESRKHDIHVHHQILQRNIEEIHEYLAHYEEPWVSEGQVRRALARWKREEPARWRTAEELETNNMIAAMASPGNKPDTPEIPAVKTVPTAVQDHNMQKTMRQRHVGLGRTMSSSANKNHNNQGSSVPRSLSLKNSLSQSRSDSAADFKANISPAIMKSQFANKDFANKLHYKPPDLLSPGHKRSNTTGQSPVPSPTASDGGPKSPGHSRSNTEQLSSKTTYVLPSGPMSPGQRISDAIKNQFASMSNHYKSPDVLSPPMSRGNSLTSKSSLSSPRRSDLLQPLSPHLSKPTASSHSPKFSFDQGNSEKLQQQDEGPGRNRSESPVLPQALGPSRPPRDENDEAIPIRTTIFPTIDYGRDQLSAPSNLTTQNPTYDQIGRSSPALNQKSSYYEIGRATSPRLNQKPSYEQIPAAAPMLARKPSTDQIRAVTPVLNKKPSFDQIGRGTPARTILPGPDGRYRPEPQTSRNDGFPVRSSSLVRRFPPSQSPNTNYAPPPPPPPPPPQESQSPDYGSYAAQNPYTNNPYPSQTRENSDYGNFGGDNTYPLPAPVPVTDYKDTINSSISTSSVPIAMYPNTPETNINPLRSPPQSSQFPYQNQNPTPSAYDESIYEDYPDNVIQTETPKRTQSQRAARRITIWDGANGFTDPGAMPVIEESPGELEREREREQKMVEERNRRVTVWDGVNGFTDLRANGFEDGGNV